MYHPETFEEIQTLIDTSQPGQTIWLKPNHVYAWSGPKEKCLKINKAITIEGQNAVLQHHSAHAIWIESELDPTPIKWTNQKFYKGDTELYPEITDESSLVLKEGDWVYVVLGQSPPDKTMAHWERLCRIRSVNPIKISRPVPWDIEPPDTRFPRTHAIRLVTSLAANISIRNLRIDSTKNNSGSSIVIQKGCNVYGQNILYTGSGILYSPRNGAENVIFDNSWGDAPVPGYPQNWHCRAIGGWQASNISYRNLVWSTAYNYACVLYAEGMNVNWNLLNAEFNSTAPQMTRQNFIGFGSGGYGNASEGYNVWIDQLRINASDTDRKIDVGHNQSGLPSVYCGVNRFSSHHSSFKFRPGVLNCGMFIDIDGEYKYFGPSTSLDSENTLEINGIIRSSTTTPIPPDSKE